jgi:hypothetical protein
MPSGDRGDPFNSTKFVVEIEGIPTSAFLAVSRIEADVAVTDIGLEMIKSPVHESCPARRNLAILC